MNQDSAEASLQQWAECVTVKGGYVIQHRETQFVYMPPQPSEAEAWSYFRTQAAAIGQGLWALLQIAPVITISFEQGGTLKTVGRPRRA